MAELRSPEVARDHDTLNEQLKEIDGDYYTDELLGVLTLNDKQYAVTEATVPDESGETTDYVDEPDYSGDILNPIEIDGEVVSANPASEFSAVGPVEEAAAEVEEVKDEKPAKKATAKKASK